ncbi:trypsin-4-like [Phymastichus coffea]|uniref:trypsin-4-like n=1 Tax=Phymastichus coffea TaxID=108790 RepID=UPI00273A9CEC|nr:trypsin-4-like [Phymastichus coffea]
MNTEILILIVAVAWSVSVEAIGSGNYISITEAPYYVAIDDKWYKYTQETNYCGGSILSEHWVITAAHCADHFQRVPMRARTGGTTQLGHGEYHEVEKVVVHPDYEDSFVAELDTAIGHNDIALLKLRAPISFSTYQQPIQLSSKPPAINDTVSLVGLGIEGQSADSASLKETQMRVGTLDDLDPKWIPTFVVTTDEHSAACAGDSGGPVVGDDNELVGILVMASGCRDWWRRSVEQFNFVTPVYVYYDWIVEHTGLGYATSGGSPRS